ncbi:MAG: hypothetical protein ABSE74_00910 [Methanoregula sp.]|jgi:hypothetical protein
MSGTSRLAEWFRDKRGRLHVRIRGRTGPFRSGSRDRGAAGRKYDFTAPDFWRGNEGAAKAGPKISGKVRVTS